jgi:hypothetical protein
MCRFTEQAFELGDVPVRDPHRSTADDRRQLAMAVVLERGEDGIALLFVADASTTSTARDGSQPTCSRPPCDDGSASEPLP